MNDPNPSREEETDQQAAEELTNPAKREGHPVIDDQLLEALQDVPHEEPFLTEAGSAEASGADAVGQVESWLPGDQENEAKSIIHHLQARPLALGANADTMFPELEPIGDDIREIIDMYLKLATSVDGVGREQQVQVLAAQFAPMGMHGMHEEEQNEKKSARFKFGDK